METIIHQIMQSVVQKMLKRIQEKKTLDEWATETLEDCKAMAIEIAQVCCDEMNKEIRKNKSSRKEKGLVLKEKERKRSLLTVLGNIQIHRDYYYDTINDCYTTPLDHILGLRPYERIGEEICARLVQESTESSYAKSAKIVCDSMVSRQSVRNCILKVNLPQEQEKEVSKKSVPELHIYADEDHVHLQKPNKQKGKKMQIVPLVTITEGTMKQTESRNKTIEPVHFVHQHFDTKELWRDVDQYIQTHYETQDLQKIYLHADGGQWIKNGLEDYPERIVVIDGFHAEKEIKSLSRMFPKKNIRQRLNKAFLENNQDKAIDILNELLQESSDKKQLEKLTKKIGYLLNHWEGIVHRKTLDIPGSCTEGQVSHVLSKRFSREPLGWSKTILGKLSKLRVYVKNGGQITGKDFQRMEAMSSSIGEEAKENLRNKLDWSIFDGEPWIFDRKSGTQILLHAIGKAGKDKIC